ncbi:hypothetical protein [Pectinatus frisingensis]|uniref:hypothetical protein n=1 Tax=Pectinatus frisingensis TaxID=865 RepID=UPI0018C609D2|nr:hypothetical protein [Pectinatus frisingensis]
MKFLYEQCGKRIECIYWSNPLKLAELEHDAKYVDEVQVWYPLTLDGEVKERYGNVLSYIELSNKWGARTASKWINLVASEKEILHGFSKNARYEVRRACNRDDLRIFFYSDENLTEKILEQYYDFYDKFAQTKEMIFLERDKIGTLVRQRAYMIGVVQDAKGVWLTAHGNILLK